MADGGGDDDDELRGRHALAQLRDTRLLDAIERRKRELPIRELAPLRLYAREPALHVEPDRWGAGFLAVRERELPSQLYSDLKQLTPQASLRDLFRPVRASVWHEREPMVPDWDPAGRRALAEAREAQLRPPLPKVAPSAREVVAEQARRRAFLKEPWQPLLSDDEPRREVELVHEPGLLV